MRASFEARRKTLRNALLRIADAERHQRAQAILLGVEQFQSRLEPLVVRRELLG